MNKAVITGTIIIIILMIGIPTYINVKKDHEDKLIKVVENRIKEAAKQCYLDEKCQSSEIDLQQLYDLNYLEEQSNPITKKIYNPESKITYNNKKVALKLS